MKPQQALPALSSLHPSWWGSPGRCWILTQPVWERRGLVMCPWKGNVMATASFFLGRNGACDPNKTKWWWWKGRPTQSLTDSCRWEDCWGGYRWKVPRGVLVLQGMAMGDAKAWAMFLFGKFPHLLTLPCYCNPLRCQAGLRYSILLPAQPWKFSIGGEDSSQENSEQWTAFLSCCSRTQEEWYSDLQVTRGQPGGWKLLQRRVAEGLLQKRGQLSSLSFLQRQPTSGVTPHTGACRVSGGEQTVFLSSFLFLCKIWLLSFRHCLCSSSFSPCCTRTTRIKTQIFSSKCCFYPRWVVEVRLLCLKKLIAQNVNTYSWLSNLLLLLCMNLDSRLCSSNCFSERIDISRCLKSLFAHNY